MQQSCTYGSVRGASGNWRPYRDKRGQTALSPSARYSYHVAQRPWTEWSVPFFSTLLERVTLFDCLRAVILVQIPTSQVVKEIEDRRQTAEDPPDVCPNGFRKNASHRKQKEKNGGDDGVRTRDLRRDRPAL